MRAFVRVFFLVISCVVCSGQKIYGQVLTVVDKITSQPLPDATIQSLQPAVSAITGAKGRADIAAFSGSDSIVVRHIGYTPVVISFQQLREMSFMLRMTESAQSLDEVVISVSRFEESRSKVPQQMTVIRTKELEFISQQTTADVLQQSGEIAVQKSQAGGGSPILRGFEANKVLLVVDGVRMNNAIYRGGHLQNIISMDQSVMSSMEVVFGPGSVMYGSDALGGVMHLQTRNPELTDSARMAVTSNAYIRYGTAASEFTGHLNFTLAGMKIASLTALTTSDFGDLRMGKERDPFYGDWGKRPWYVETVNGADSVIKNNKPHIQKPSGYKQHDFLQKIIFKPGDHVKHILNLQYSTSSNIPRYDRLTLASAEEPRFAEWYYGPQQRFFSSYTLTSDRPTSYADHARVIVAYQNIEESRHDRRYRKDTRNHRNENLDIVTLNVDLSKKIRKNEFHYGADAWYNRVHSSAYTEVIRTGELSPLDTRYPDGGSEMKSAAVYLTHSHQFRERLILNEGIRVNYVQLNARFNDTTFFPFPFREVVQKHTALTGSLGFVHGTANDLLTRINLSSGFRAPNVDDLSKVFESVPGRVIVPNPSLKPEYTWNADLGLSKNISGVVTISGTVWYTLYHDAITVMPGTFNGKDSIAYNGVTSRVTMPVNATDAYLFGYHADLTITATENFTIKSTLSYTRGRINTDTTDYPLDHIPPLFGKTSFNLKLTRFRGEFYLMYHGAKKSSDYNLLGEDNYAYSADPVNGYMPSWLTLNLRGQYSIGKYVTLLAAIENLLDRHYRIFASNISAPGRNFMFTVRARY